MPEIFKENIHKLDWQTKNLEDTAIYIAHILNSTIDDLDESVQDGFLIDIVPFLLKEMENLIHYHK